MLLLLLLLLLSLQSCPTLCDPIDVSPPGSPVTGIVQARTLEWVAISFSNTWKWKVKVKSLSRVDPYRPHGLQPTRLLHPWDFPGESTGVGCQCLFHEYAYIYALQRLFVLNTFYLYQERAKQIQSLMLLCLVFPLNLLNQVLVFTLNWVESTPSLFSPSAY